MSDPVEPKPEPKKARRRSKKNGTPEVVASPTEVVPQTNASVTQSFTLDQAKELASIAIQATRYGPNPAFLQGQPVGLIKQALIESMPPAWREKNAHAWVESVQHPEQLLILLTFFAAYWNLGFQVGHDHGKRANEAK